MDRLFHPWIIDFVSLCSYLYRTFYLHGNHVIHPVYHADVTLDVILTLEILQTLTTY